jgi:hypothetical protein
VVVKVRDRLTFVLDVISGPCDFAQGDKESHYAVRNSYPQSHSAEGARATWQESTTTQVERRVRLRTIPKPRKWLTNEVRNTTTKTEGRGACVHAEVKEVVDERSEEHHDEDRGQGRLRACRGQGSG